MRRVSIEELERLGPASLAEVPARVRDAVRAITSEVRSGGLEALERLRRRFDGPAGAGALEVPPDRWQAALEGLDGSLRAALEAAAARIRAFAEAQRAGLRDIELETAPGVICAQRVRPVARVGCYVPGGRHPLPSTLLMTALPARVAGVGEVVVACPDPAPAVLAAAAIAGVDRVLAMGGAHAVAALAFGAGEAVPRVDLICGPGGVYVAEAKRQLHGVVGTDLPAGPSEVLVLADDAADPARVIADLEAQAEHDPAARPLLATTSPALADAVERHAAAGFSGRPNADALAPAFADNGLIALCGDRAELCRAADALAPEHLAVHTADADALLAQCSHFGAAFVGGAAAEVFGDYGAGPNHVLPTAGAARFTAGLSVASFLRLQTVTRMTAAGAAALAEPAALLAEAEGLHAHARAARLRAATAGR